MLIELKRKEAGQMRFDTQADITAPASVSSVRPTLGHIFLSAKRRRAVAAISCFHINASTINEHGSPTLFRTNAPAHRWVRGALLSIRARCQAWRAAPDLHGWSRWPVPHAGV